MKINEIVFRGYDAGVTEFASVFQRNPEALAQLLAVVERIVMAVAEPARGQYTSLVIVGHSDRQDRSDMNCDQRRASEIAAARDRAVSAWEWVAARVTHRLADFGIDVGPWWDTSPVFAWGLVYAAAGMLDHNPPTDQQRPLNRRVVILVAP